ncbi:MAG: MBL fold metallo-hydrolase [Deltaproteobacteria bacterium]|nr:MBL fold metallo-hydrolase [Deltaproteobacteria bacterium]
MKRWKKALIALGAVIATLLLAAFAMYLSAFGGRAPMTDADLQPGVHVVPMGFVSAFIIEAGPGQVALIDTGVDPEGKAILAALQARGLTRESVRAIFITHGHGDHIAAIKKFPEAQVYALETERALVAGEVTGTSPMGKLQKPNATGITLSRGLSDGEQVKVGDTTVTAFAVPGHTSGSAAYLVKGALLLGDAATVSPKGQVIGPVWMFSGDTSLGRESLRKLGVRLQGEHLEVRALGFAHCGPLMGDGAQALRGVE